MNTRISIDRAGFERDQTLYARMRPSYPRYILQRLREVGVSLEGARLLDLGCGTGKLASLLSKGGAVVTGIDISLPMLRTLQNSRNSFSAVNGLAEFLPYKSETFSIVCSGQAFHWFEPELSLLEVRRVLRIGGFFVAIWNIRVRSHLVYETIDDYLRGFRHDAPRHTEVDWKELIGSHSFFNRIIQQEIGWSRRVSPDYLINLAMTRSYIARRPLAQQRAIRKSVHDILHKKKREAYQLKYLCRMVVAQLSR